MNRIPAATCLRRTLRLLLLPALLLAAAVRADYPIEIIELRAATLDEVIPVLRPLAGPDGTVTGMRDRLVIKAAPERVREIREVLARIDRPPRRLRITVSTAGDGDGRATAYRGEAEIRRGDSRAAINTPGTRSGDARAGVRAGQREVHGMRGGAQTVHAVEGRPAWILGGTGGYLSDPGVDAASRGFQVVPRVSGRRVTLEILQQDARPGRLPAYPRVQRIGSVVHGRLGEWIDLGGVAATAQRQDGGPARAGRTAAGWSQHVRVRVECPDCPGG